MMIRRATPQDAGGINAVYNPYILDSPATFETEPISDGARRQWVTDLSADPRFPVFVAEDENASIVGFANAAPFDPRPAYGTSVKTSIFMMPDEQGTGTGRRLYEAVFDALAETDVHRAYGLIVAPNDASAALHLRLGFRHISTLNEVGRKFGSFHDVMWFEKQF